MVLTRQFDVHHTRGDAKKLAPYLVNLQNEVLGELATVLVAPMRPAGDHGPVLKRAQVEVEFDGQPCVVAPEQMVSLPRAALGPRAGTIEPARQELLAAVDFLFIGF